MKKIAKLLVLIMLVMASASLFSQDPPDPNGGIDPNGDNTPVGGRATVSGGIILLLVLGAAYGGKKVYDLRKKNQTV